MVEISVEPEPRMSVISGVVEKIINGIGEGSSSVVVLDFKNNFLAPCCWFEPHTYKRVNDSTYVVRPIHQVIELLRKEGYDVSCQLPALLCPQLYLRVGNRVKF